MFDKKWKETDDKWLGVIAAGATTGAAAIAAMAAIAVAKLLVTF